MSQLHAFVDRPEPEIGLSQIDWLEKSSAQLARMGAFPLGAEHLDQYGWTLARQMLDQGGRIDC